MERGDWHGRGKKNYHVIEEEETVLWAELLKYYLGRGQSKLHASRNDFPGCPPKS